MGTKVGFGKALRTLSDLADALVASGALTEMTGSEFVAYAAGQLALASIEPRDQAATRIAALKAAIVTAQEQARGLPTSGDVVVFVKVYDSDEAAMANIEAGVASCKSALAALRSPYQEQLAGLNQELGNAEPVVAAAPAPRVTRRAPEPVRATSSRNFHDDDPDADDWLVENDGRRDDLDEDQDPSDEIDDVADEDDLDAYMKSISSTTQVEPRAKGRPVPAPQAPAPRARQPQAPARPARTKQGPKQAPPKRIPMPRPMSPADVARAVREGHGEKGGSRLTTARSSMRG